MTETTARAPAPNAPPAPPSCDDRRIREAEVIAGVLVSLRLFVRLGGRVYLTELARAYVARYGPEVREPWPARHGTVFFDSMVMVFATRGRQRSASEPRSLLEAAEVADLSPLPTAGYDSLVRGRKE